MNGNWSPSGVPGASDDVIHNNSDVILMNVGSQGSPTTVNSFTCTGSAGGGLVIQTNRGLIVKGDFNNSSTGSGDRYEVTLDEHSRLDVGDGSNVSDLIRVSLTMEPVPTGDPTTLLVTGAIESGDYTVTEGCLVTVGSGTGADVSVLDGQWTIEDGAEVEFQYSMLASSDAPLVLTIAGNSTLTVLEPFYGSGTFVTDELCELHYGAGDNILEIGQSGADYPAFDLGPSAVVARDANAGSLTIDLYGKTAIRSYFGYAAVGEVWDTRDVDLVYRPVFESAGPPAHPLFVETRLELISTTLTPWFPGVPVIFLDVPCLGAWRDLILPGTSTTGSSKVSAGDEWNNSITDGELCTGLCSVNESGYFRDITIGDNRTLNVAPTNIGYEPRRIFFYGTRTISSSGKVYTDTTELTGAAIDDYLVQAVGTIYGDWNGDCEIAARELADLEEAIEEEEEGYNPLMDYNCDGELADELEGAAAATNYIEQPACGESFMMMGGGGQEEQWSEMFLSLGEMDELADWLETCFDSPELAEFISDLEAKAAELSGTPLGFEMAALLEALEDEQ